MSAVRNLSTIVPDLSTTAPSVGTVLVTGCFDPFHWGHLVHFYAARAFGARLVVAVTADRHVGKGPGRPVFNVEQRAAVLRALRGLVDEVIVSDEAVPMRVIAAVRPAFYVKGIDYKGAELPERELVESLGGKVVFTETPKYSATEIVKRK